MESRFMASTFQCTLVTPEREALNEQVVYASIPAWDGLIGIAPQRAPLLVKLGDGPLRLDLPQGQTRHFFVSGGFAQLKENVLSIVSEQAMAPDQLDAALAQKSLDEALAHPAVGEQETQAKQRQVSRARAMLAMIQSQPKA